MATLDLLIWVRGEKRVRDRSRPIVRQSPSGMAFLVVLASAAAFFGGAVWAVSASATAPVAKAIMAANPVKRTTCIELFLPFPCALWRLCFDAILRCIPAIDNGEAYTASARHKISRWRRRRVVA